MRATCCVKWRAAALLVVLIVLQPNAPALAQQDPNCTYILGLCMSCKGDRKCPNVGQATGRSNEQLRNFSSPNSSAPDSSGPSVTEQSPQSNQTARSVARRPSSGRLNRATAPGQRAPIPAKSPRQSKNTAATQGPAKRPVQTQPITKPENVAPAVAVASSVQNVAVAAACTPAQTLAQQEREFDRFKSFMRNEKLFAASASDQEMFEIYVKFKMWERKHLIKGAKAGQ